MSIENPYENIKPIREVVEAEKAPEDKILPFLQGVLDDLKHVESIIDDIDMDSLKQDVATYRESIFILGKIHARLEQIQQLL